MIGPGEPAFIIAEAGVNHNGRLDLAHRLVDVAVEAGADAVKFQTFRADRLAVREAPKAVYQLETTDAEESLTEMLRRLELSEEAHVALCGHCRSRGIVFLSTPFDEESADFLEKLGVSAFKISSGDLTNIPFLEHVACKGLPTIISSGMATLDEVRDAVRAIQDAGLRDIAVLHCVSNYPARAEDVNLRAMRTLADIFGIPIGFSDHTLGAEVALAAVAVGARILEKHFTLDPNMPGPDHRASLPPDALRALVTGVRTVEASLGTGVKAPCPSESEVAAVARKSLYWARDLHAGEMVARADLIALRPATGISPARMRQLIGRRLLRAVRDGEPVRADDIE